MEWYYAKDGVQHGPVEKGVIKAAVDRGELGPRDLAWRQGMTEWKPIGEIGELASATALAGTPSPVDSPYRPPSVSPVAPGVPVTPLRPPDGSGKATAALVLGILGLVFSCIPCLGLILGILAVVYGGQVLDAANLRSELQPYCGNANAGKIMGIVAIVLSVLFMFANVAIRVGNG